MSKTKKSYKFNDYSELDEEDHLKNVRDQERRKNKRLANILRSKNVDLLMQLEEDEDNV